MVAISDHCCHDFSCVVNSSIGVAIHIRYCNSLANGCDSAPMLQQICFVVCNRRLRCNRVVHIATKNYMVAIAKVTRLVKI
jgi:hypothetical protein